MLSKSLTTAAAGSGGEYQIERSLRFNSADSAYLSRTPASAGNRKTWTWSGWVKRSALGGANIRLLSGRLNAANQNDITYDSSNRLVVYFGGTNTYVETSAVFRDTSAWYHVVVIWNTPATTSTDRVKIYVNGVLQTVTFSATITQNADGDINNATANYIGAFQGSSNYFDGYLAEINFIDGQALTPSSFGEVDSVTGVWKPIAYAGTYGTNGFHLDFSDNSSTTALGTDSSGNGNNWTPNNFSVTAGAGNDSLVDSPTQYGTDTGAGGEVRGNYGTWNALGTNKPTLTNGNLDADGSDLKVAISTMGVSTGKWYWEISIGSGTDTPNMGVTAYANDNSSPGVYLGVGRSYVSGGGGGGVYKPYTGTSTTANSAFSNANTAGATIGFALDCDAGTLAYYVNNVLGYTDSTIATGTLLFPMTTNFNSGANAYRNTSVNFGQRPFAYTAPSGFKALVTTNLPDPTILEGDQHFNTVLYTGNGTTQSITGVGFQPDFVWLKNRSGVENHQVFDVLRGVNNSLYPNLTNAASGFDPGVSAFNSDGFSLGGTSNTNTNTYVAWNWKANGAGGTNNDGNTQTTVSANTTAGISIITFTTPASFTNETFGHGLGTTPAMLIVKSRGTVGLWNVWHKDLGVNGEIYLNSTSAKVTNANGFNGTSSTTFTLGTSGNWGGNYTYLTYAFAEVEGFSKFGSYTGNGSDDGPFVYTGFRPSLVLYKASSTTSSWFLNDNQRDGYNFANKDLYPEDSAAESVGGFIDILSNGFKLRTTSARNTNGATYIFMAFAENPFKNALAR